MESKKVVMIAIAVVVAGVFGWQVMDYLNEQEAAELAAKQAASRPKPMETPKQASLMNDAKPGASTPAAANNPALAQPVLTEREIEILKLQQETQARYLAALDQLQILKVQKDIADANKDIMKARLDAITAQRKIVDMLAPPPVTAPTLDSSKKTTASTTTETANSGEFTVVSISNIQGRWMAVLSAGGKLTSVTSGDVASDGSTVTSIDRSGVTMTKDGETRKILMASVI